MQAADFFAPDSRGIPTGSPNDNAVAVAAAAEQRLAIRLCADFDKPGGGILRAFASRVCLTLERYGASARPPCGEGARSSAGRASDF